MNGNFVCSIPANFHLHLAAHVRSGFDNFFHLLCILWYPQLHNSQKDLLHMFLLSVNANYIQKICKEFVVMSSKYYYIADVSRIFLLQLSVINMTSKQFFSYPSISNLGNDQLFIFSPNLSADKDWKMVFFSGNERLQDGM